MTTIQIQTSPNAAFEVAHSDKNTRHRLGAFTAWLDERGEHWSAIDLGVYRDYLLHERQPVLAPISVINHLATVRSRYRSLLESNWLRDQLYALTPPEAAPSDRKALVDEAIIRIQNNINPRTSAVQVIDVQDRADSEQHRLTIDQSNALMNSPWLAHDRDSHPDVGGDDCPVCLRDQSIIALLLCTGIREQELCNLDVDDLRQRYQGATALRVRRGKGAKQRLVPYGQLDWCLAYVDEWLKLAGVTSGPVLRGFYPYYKKVRESRVNPSTIQRVLAAYPIKIEGQMVTVTPHDLRRTYAVRCWEAGVPLEAIQQNLGHYEQKTTLAYIGSLNAGVRSPGEIYQQRKRGHESRRR